MSEPTVLIAGAGLGGLSLAQALHGYGIAVRLFERDEQYRPQYVTDGNVQLQRRPGRAA